MNSITLLVGPPGSGKSTMARRYEEQGYVRISQDDQGKEGHLFLFNKALKENRNIIVDRMGFSKIQRDRYLLPAKTLGYETSINVIHESYDECLARMAYRVDHPTIKDDKSAISALNTFFCKYERVEDNEADHINRIFPKVDSNNTAIWIDIDNTLSNTKHREFTLLGERKDWKKFFSLMDKDEVNEWCKALINGMVFVHNILICSARPDNYRQITENWLNNNNIPFDKLIMRPLGDYRKDSIVKEIFYEFEIKTKYNLLFSVDDRKQVIDQIRKHGVIVLDCAGEKGYF